MTITTQAFRPKLDLPPYVGQRAASFRFELVDTVTGYTDAVTPLGEDVTLVHDTSRVIKRQLTNVFFSRDDTARFNQITSRLHVYMIVGGEEFSLGRYVPASHLRYPFYNHGDRSASGFVDESVIIDQEIDSSFGANNTAGENIYLMLQRFLARYTSISATVADTSFTSTGSWGVGTRGGVVVEQLALDGDYFSPWMDHNGVYRFIRSFDPSSELPTFDLDSGGRVIRSSVIRSDNLIDAPNRYIVVSNSAASQDDSIVGFADVPDSAPNSIANRGFIIPRTIIRQVETSLQAAAVARNLALRQVIVESVELLTPPDPRHDSYDVIRWDGVNWLETSWSLTLREGAPMRHVARRAYPL